MYSEIGFECVTAAQLANLVILIRGGEICAFDARVYLGAVELASRREVAKRIRKQRHSKVERASQYSIAELARLVPNTSFVRLKRALKKLASVGLLRFSTEQITFETATLFPEHELVREFTKRGALSRLIPIPRRLFVELCCESKKSLLLTKLAYVMRGLALEQKTGALRSRGCIKASWIADHFGLSLRAVRLARRALIDSSFITKDRLSFQRKLNRDGSYFEIDLGRYAGTLRVAKECKSNDLTIVPAQSPTESAGTVTNRPAVVSGGCLETTGSFLVPTGRIAPPRPKMQARFAPLREKQETPNGSKNQKTRHTDETGFYTKKIKRPVLKNIQPDDLRRVSTLKALYHQALKAKWLEPSEANFQNFVSAAARATRINGNPVRVFVAIVKGKLWHHITAEQEDRARVVIRNYEEKNNSLPNRFAHGAGHPTHIRELARQVATSLQP